MGFSFPRILALCSRSRKAGHTIRRMKRAGRGRSFPPIQLVHTSWGKARDWTLHHKDHQKTWQIWDVTLVDKCRGLSIISCDRLTIHITEIETRSGAWNPTQHNTFSTGTALSHSIAHGIRQLVSGGSRKGKGFFEHLPKNQFLKAKFKRWFESITTCDTSVEPAAMPNDLSVSPPPKLSRIRSVCRVYHLW